MTDRGASAGAGSGPEGNLTVRDIATCFEGAVPGVLCTAAADGTPNVTYLSRAHQVDEERVALSNQFLSKTARNVAVNPRASLLLLDPFTYDQYRLQLTYERTERRGPTFERLRADIDALAELEGMQDVFRLRAADIYRVTAIDLVPAGPHGAVPPSLAAALPRPTLEGLAALTARLARCVTLDDLLDAALEGLDDLLGYRHTYLLLADADGQRLSTFASRGFDGEAIGAEVELGQGLVGAAAARCAPVRVGNLRQVGKYSRSVRTSYEEAGGEVAGPVVALPGRPDAESLVAVPAQARGELVGVVVAESPVQVAFGPRDEQVLGVVAALVAQAVEHLRAVDAGDGIEEAGLAPTPVAPRPPISDAATTTVRFYDVDGSTFVDGEYLIRGVAGRILWALLGHHQRDGRTEFTNKELRLDPSLDLPGFKDNLESRLLLLKRRLDERGAPIRLVKTGRGRFRMDVDTTLDLVRAGRRRRSTATCRDRAGTLCRRSLPHHGRPPDDRRMAMAVDRSSAATTATLDANEAVSVGGLLRQRHDHLPDHPGVADVASTLTSGPRQAGPTCGARCPSWPRCSLKAVRRAPCTERSRPAVWRPASRHRRGPR
ncbi:MAG: GAF domain-containing protein [Acidimicrobiales bacterium]